MKLSEKTLEINICSQLTQMLKQNIIWFGLTQKQEARAGFDVCTRLGGRLIIFQFKASSQMVRGAKRFYAPHKQLEALRQRCQSFIRSVFYVFPMVSTTYELSKDNNIIKNTWLLDVATLPPITFPLTRRGTPRKNSLHHIDLTPPTVKIHSEPITAEVINALNFAKNGFPGTDGINWKVKDNHDDFEKFHQLVKHNSIGMILVNDRR